MGNLLNRKSNFVFLAAIIFLASVISIYSVQANAATNIIRVTSSAELFTALKNAEPGDEIVIAEGVYEGKLGSNASGHGSSFFNSDRDGTQANPIILRSENPANKSVLCGSRISGGNVLRITGDYWVIKDLEMTYAQKGIMLDHSNYTVIENCDVYNVGMEGIHLRDNSSYNIVDGCTVTDTGKQTPAYGEGIYVGSAKSAWNTYGENCHYNTIKNCYLGPEVTAEHVDIKEGTIGTIVEYCVMDGTGMTGLNYADSFVDAKGNDGIIRFNTCYRNNNSIIVDAFQVHSQLDGWGVRNIFQENTVYLDDDTAYVIQAPNAATAIASGNVRLPAGNMYRGNVTVIDDPDTPTPVPEPEPEPSIQPDTYDSSQAYAAGDIVVYQGQTFKAKWWTQGTAPNVNDTWGPWQLID